MRYPDPPYTEKFRGWVREAMPKIARNVKDTALYIVSRDAGAVVIIIGDHRGWPLQDRGKQSDPSFFGESLGPTREYPEDGRVNRLRCVPRRLLREPHGGIRF